MKTKYLIGLLMIMLIFTSGCVEKECEASTDCIDKTCSDVACENSICVYSIISNCCGNDKCEVGEDYTSCFDDCPNCDDNNECTDDSYDYHQEGCVNKLDFDEVCCGNTLCELGEDYNTCTKDCPSCDDNDACTKDSYDYHRQECVNEVIVPCCGNGMCDEGAEDSSSCAVDCPDCDDGNKLTEDSFNHDDQECENVVAYYFIDDFEQGVGNWDFFRDEGWSTEVEEDGNTVLRLIAANGNIPIVLENYIFKFRFKWAEGNMHANFRQGNVDGEYNRYMVGMSHRGVDSLNKQSGKDFQTINNELNVNLDEGWHTLEIRNYNNIINIYADDNLVTIYEDTDNPILSGKVGFEVHTGGSPVTPEYLIDDVEIKIIDEEDIIYP